VSSLCPSTVSNITSMPVGHSKCELPQFSLLLSFLLKGLGITAVTDANTNTDIQGLGSPVG
jgi:hypothetical protein